MSRYRDAGLFLLLAVAWGSAFTAIKAGLAVFPPVLFAAIRYDAAALLLLGYAWVATDRPVPRSRAEWELVGVSAAFMIAGYHALLFVGEQQTTSAAAAVIVSLVPLLTAGFARLWLPSERLTAVGLVGLVLGLLGVAAIADPAPGPVLAGGADGELLILGAAVSFALGSVLARRSPAELPVETLQAWAMLGGAGLLHGLSLALGESAGTIDWTLRGVLALGYLVVVASALGFLVYFTLLERLGPTQINLVSYAAPAAAAVTGLAVLGEQPTVSTAAGFLLILAGFVLVKREELRAELRRWSAA